MSPQKKVMVGGKTLTSSPPKDLHPVLERVGKAVAEGVQTRKVMRAAQDTNTIPGKNARHLVIWI